MTLLFTFGGKAFDKNRRCLPMDTDHKPGGLWLSEDREDGWKNLVLRGISEHPEEWCNGDLKFVSIFGIELNRSIKDILTIASKEDMESFLENYLETSMRSCKSEDLENITGQCISGCTGRCFNCYGYHINWDSVKVDYKGLALGYYSREVSHRSKNPKLHWSRFDCASWCIWDTSCLTPIMVNVMTEYRCDGKCSSCFCPEK